MDHTKLEQLVQAAREQKPDQFATAFKEAVSEKLLERIDTMRQDISANFFQPISEQIDGRHIIDGLKKIVDTRKQMVFRLDNGDDITVDVDAAEKLVNFYNLHDQEQQYYLQRKMRRSAHEFLNTAAGAGANIAEVVSNGRI